MTGPAGTPAGRPAGTVAGTTAGTSAGTPAGPPAGGSGSRPVTAATASPVAEPPTTTAEKADAPAATPKARRGAGLPGGRLSWLAAAVAVVAIVLAVAALALLRPSSDEEVRESALLAARTYTQSLVTYDARTLDEDVARVKGASTEEFAAQYEETINGLREAIASEQRVSSGTVLGAGLEDLDDTAATVLVAVNQDLASNAGEPRTEANRLRMVLERAEGRWLIQSVTRL